VEDGVNYSMTLARFNFYLIFFGNKSEEKIWHFRLYMKDFIRINGGVLINFAR
jgi:hypothetical protein